MKGTWVSKGMWEKRVYRKTAKIKKGKNSNKQDQNVLSKGLDEEKRRTQTMKHGLFEMEGKRKAKKH